MIPKYQQNLVGYLLSSVSQALEREDILHSEFVEFVGIIKGTRWEEYLFRSNQPLLDELEFEIEGPYNYPFVCRRSGSKIIMLSTGKRVVEYLLSDVYSEIFRPNLRHIRIAVDGLVKKISQNPDKYVLSFVHARIPAFGNTLRAVSFYGDDIAEAEFFRDHLDLFNCFTCGLRNVTGGPEIIRLNSEGMVSFYCSGSDRILEVEAVLGYISELGFFS